jgi:anti-anti-sigma factor
MSDDVCPVQWAGSLAVIALPEHIDVSNAGQIREELLSVIHRGARSLIADMTATISCDHAGADALLRARRRAVTAGTELRLVVTAQVVARVLSIIGLDRLVSIYPSLDAAAAARPPAPVLALAAAGIAAAGNGGHAPPRRARQATAPIRAAGAPDGNGAVITPAVLWKLVDALQEGVALADGSGMIMLANSRLEDMFGYLHGEALGRPVGALIPAHLQEAHLSYRAGYASAAAAGPVGAGRRLVGQRKDGTTFPAEISLTPVATGAGLFALTVIRDVTEARRLEDLASLAAAAVTAEQARRSLRVLDTVVTSLFGAGLGLQAALDLPAEAGKQHIAEALSRLDDAIREIRQAAFATPGQSASHPARADVTA